MEEGMNLYAPVKVQAEEYKLNEKDMSVFRLMSAICELTLTKHYCRKCKSKRVFRGDRYGVCVFCFESYTFKK